MAKIFNDQNFADEVIEASKEKPVLVDFYAEWCGPCKIQAPLIDEVSDEIGDKAVVGKANTEESPQVSRVYNIMSIPSLKIFRNGEVVEDFLGLQGKEVLLEALTRNI